MVCVGAASELAAQALRGGDLVTTNLAGPAAVFRIDASGSVTTLLAGSPLVAPSGITALRTRDVVVADYSASSLVRIDAATGAASTVATGLAAPLRVCEDLDGNFIVTSSTGRSLLRVTPAGQVTTVVSASTSVLLVRPFGVACDLNGDYLVADDFAVALLRITPAGVVSTIHAGPPLSLPRGAAVFPDGDYAVIDGITDQVYRIGRTTGAITVFCNSASLGGNPEGIVPDFAGGMLVSQSQASGSRVVRLDAAGAATQVAAGAPFTNLEDLAKVPHLVSPRQVTSGPGSVFSITVDAPGLPGQYYSLAFAASVFPGFVIPGSSLRLALNLDPFLYASIGQNAPPALVGNTGFLDAQGRATATLDLAALPPGFASGLLLFQQGITLSAQNQITSAFNVVRLGFP